MEGLMLPSVAYPYEDVHIPLYSSLYLLGSSLVFGAGYIRLRLIGCYFLKVHACNDPIVSAFPQVHLYRQSHP